MLAFRAPTTTLFSRVCSAALVILGVAGAACQGQDGGDRPSTAADEEDWTQYPLSRDDPRAQLDPKWVAALSASSPTPTLRTDRVPPTAEQKNHMRRGKRYEFATGTVTSLGDAPAGAGGQPGTAPDKDLFGKPNQGVLSLAEEGDVGHAQEPLIFGADERLAVLRPTRWPWRVRTKVLTTYWGGSIGDCSGTIIEDKYVLTAAHCVYDASLGGWPASVAVIPALEGNYMPFGQANATVVSAVEGYTDYGDGDYDYALITLDRKVGLATGWHPLCSLSDSSWDNELFTVAGYPGDWPGRAFMGSSSGVVENYDSSNIYHQADTVGGMSGSTIQPWSVGGEYACAVHTGWDYYGFYQYNEAVRVTNSMFYQLYDWMSTWYNEWEASFPYTSYWVSLGGAVVLPMAATTSKNGRYFDLFATDMYNGGVYHKAATSSGYIPSILGWTPIGGYTESAPAAISRMNGYLDVFIWDPNAQGIFNKAWNGSAWIPSDTGWWPLATGSFAPASPPTVVSWGSNRLDVFTRRGDGAVMHIAWNGSWGAWEDLGGPAFYGVTAVSRAANVIDVFVQGAGAKLYHKKWNGSTWVPSQTGWTNLGAPIIGTLPQIIKESPTVVAPSSSRLDVFARGADDAVWAKTWYPASGWGSWISLGGQTTAPIAAVSRASGWYDLFMRDGRNGGGIFTKSWNGTSWWPSQTDWSNLGGDVFDVTVTSSGSNRLEVFSRSWNNHVGYRWWDGTRWWM